MTDITHEEHVSSHEIIRKDSIEELVGHRNRALELARQALTILVEGERAAQRATQSTYGGFIDVLVTDRLYDLESPEKQAQLMQAIQHRIDGYAWRGLQRRSGLRNLMDSTAHEQMSKQLQDHPPPFTVDNAVATFSSLAGQAPSIFERSIVEVFKRLDTKHYHTNSAFRITPRIVLTRVFDTYGYSRWGAQRELMGDLDRIFHILDGKKPPEAGNAADVIEAAFRAKLSRCITEYFDVRMFHGNGNMHLKFRRLDLLNRANDVIAKRYGKALPDDAKI